MMSPGYADPVWVPTWVLPVLWREHDWRVALDRLAVELATRGEDEPVAWVALELGRACEYIEPDRRRAIYIYGLAGAADRGRGAELATELGWWAGRARLATALLDEAEAWWDAGQPELCAYAVARVRKTENTRLDELGLLLEGQHLEAHAAAVARRAATLGGAAAADAFVMASRFAYAAGADDERARLLEAALIAQRGHPVAATQLLQLVLARGEPKALSAFLRTRLEKLDPVSWIDGVRATAFAMIDDGRHRGFGLRLLRRALERAYDARLADIPGHLAMWIVLAAHAAADDTRREILDLAIRGVQAAQHPVDRVWLATLATEISLREGNSPVIAGAYAELVAEHAPDHPIVRELVAAVAAADHGEGVPAAAIAAATNELARLPSDNGAELAQSCTDAISAALAAAPPRQPAPPPVTPPADRQRSRSVPLVVVPPTRQRTTAVIAIPPIAIPPPKPRTSVAPKPAPTRSAVSTTPPPLRRPPSQPSPPPAGVRASRRPSDPQQMLAALRVPDRPATPPLPEPAATDAAARQRRITVPIDVRLAMPDGTRIEGHSRNVSASGLFVHATILPEVSGEVAVTLLIPGKEAFTEDEHRARGRIVRRTDDGVEVELVDAPATLLAALKALGA